MIIKKMSFAFVVFAICNYGNCRFLCLSWNCFWKSHKRSWKDRENGQYDRWVKMILSQSFFCVATCKSVVPTQVYLATHCLGLQNHY